MTSIEFPTVSAVAQASCGTSDEGHSIFVGRDVNGGLPHGMARQKLLVDDEPDVQIACLPYLAHLLPLSFRISPSRPCPVVKPRRIGMDAVSR